MAKREMEKRKKAGETQTRRSWEKPSGGAEELAALSLTAAGPLHNPGISSEINLSARSC